jgi:hypothetical protein
MPDLAPQGFLHRLAARHLGQAPLIRPRPRARFEMVGLPEESLAEITVYQNRPTPQRSVERPRPLSPEFSAPPAPFSESYQASPVTGPTLVAPPPAVSQQADPAVLAPKAPSAADRDHEVVRPRPAAPEPAVIMTELKLVDRPQLEPIASFAPTGPPPSATAQPIARLTAPPRLAATPAPVTPPGSQVTVQPAEARPAPGESAQPATVHVTIGRVEIRATPATPNGRSTTRKRPPARSLDDYLDGRREG